MKSPICEPHNHWYRRFKRRIPFTISGFWTIVSIGPLVLAPIALAVWLQPNGYHSAWGIAFRWLWAVTILLHATMIGLIGLVVMPLKMLPPNVKPIDFVITTITGLCVLIALLFDQIAIAVAVAYFGSSISRTVTAARNRSVVGAVTAVLCLVTVAGFLRSNAMLAITACLTLYVADMCNHVVKATRPVLVRSLRSAISNKPSRVEHGFSGHQLHRASFLGPHAAKRTFCEADMGNEAMIAMEKMRPQDRINFGHQSDLCWIYCGQEKYEEVLELVGSDIEPDVRLAPAFAVALAHSGRLQEARNAAHRAIEKRTNYGELAMGLVEEQAAEFEEALCWFERVASRQGQRPAAMRRVAFSLISLHDDKGACMALEQAIRLSRFVRVEDLELLAKLLMRLGQPDKAEEVNSLAGEFQARDDAKRLAMRKWYWN